MTDTSTATAVVVNPPARLSWKDFVPVVALIITVVTLLVGGGKVLASIDDATRRIAKLEQRADRRDDDTSDLRERIAAMDAKLDLLVKRTSADRP